MLALSIEDYSKLIYTWYQSNDFDYEVGVCTLGDIIFVTMY